MLICILTKTEITSLSLHDALPISILVGLADLAADGGSPVARGGGNALAADADLVRSAGDRKSTRLNSSHTVISYAVFCLKKNTTSIDIMGLQAAYANLHTDQERDY